MIEVRNLVKEYGEKTAVDDLSFTVEKGQILGFLGPNGAGKSTTMNIITGYIAPTKGTVLIDGHDILKEPMKAKKGIGYLPEIPPLYPDMTVKEYLKFVADLKGVKKTEKEKMISEIMELTKISEKSQSIIKYLSKGYKQRVGLAGAIIGYPDVIILDEPTVGLDPMQIIEMRDLIKNLSKDHTIILSSHILSEVSAICDEVMIINQGKLVIADTTKNLEKHMEGKNSLKLIVKGNEQQVEGVLVFIDEIIDYKIECQDNSEFTVAEIEFLPENDIREELFYSFANAKCPIYEMQMSQKTLEDIFLELTKTDVEEKEEINNERDI